MWQTKAFIFFFVLSRSDMYFWALIVDKFELIATPIAIFYATVNCHKLPVNSNMTLED